MFTINPWCLFLGLNCTSCVQLENEIKALKWKLAKFKQKARCVQGNIRLNEYVIYEKISGTP